jgi:hypothetical protein
MRFDRTVSYESSQSSTGVRNGMPRVSVITVFHGAHHSA